MTNSAAQNPTHDHPHEGHAHDHDEVPTDPAEAEAYWDARYAESEHNNGQPNPVLVQVAQSLTPGTALDLGSGYGDDVVWLAGQGWNVTGVDVSGAAVTRATAAAKAAGVADRTTFAQHDLGRDFPGGEFDLVTTHYLHSPADLPRDAVLRRAADVVAPGGTLLIVGHATLPPWAWENHRHEDMPDADHVWATLDLPSEGWELVRLDLTDRPVTGPDGQQATMADSIVQARRR